MRNILVYPITPGEVQATVKEALDKYIESQAVGGIDGVVWYALLNALKMQVVMDIVLENANP
jgi:hypothetical protein